MANEENTFIHGEESEFAGQKCRVTSFIDTNNPKIEEGDEIYIEDWWDRVYGESWKTSEGNPPALIYAIRSATKHLPPDDEVLYGKVDGLGVLVHKHEIELLDESN